MEDHLQAARGAGVRNGVPGFTWWALLCLPAGPCPIGHIPTPRPAQGLEGAQRAACPEGEDGEMLGALSIRRGTGEEGEVHLKLGGADSALGTDRQTDRPRSSFTIGIYDQKHIDLSNLQPLRGLRPPLFVLGVGLSPGAGGAVRSLPML